jgi:putative transposase
MMLNRFGIIAFKCWASLPEHHPQVILDEFVVMPNHIHGILWLCGEVNSETNFEVKREFGKPQSGSLSVIVNCYKAGVSRRISTLRGQKTRVWQPRFHEHIIRDDDDLLRQREYIQNNPAQWQDDEMNSAL